MTGPRETAMTAGFDVARMLVLLDEAYALIESGAEPGTNWSEKAEQWVMDHGDWRSAEDIRLAEDEPRERIDRPEREQEPTAASIVAERDSGWRSGRELVERLRQSERRYRREDRTEQLGQSHVDVHSAWHHLGFSEGVRDGLHAHYGYPRAAS